MQIFADLLVKKLRNWFPKYTLHAQNNSMKKYHGENCVHFVN